MCHGRHFAMWDGSSSSSSLPPPGHLQKRTIYRVRGIAWRSFTTAHQSTSFTSYTHKLITMAQEANKVETYFSGGPGTTGREPFEDSTGAGAVPIGQTASGAVPGELGAHGTEHHHHSHHHHHHQHREHEDDHPHEHGATSGAHQVTGDHGNRVGALSQEAHKYEGDNAGPVTGGAPGTDRFDTTTSSGAQHPGYEPHEATERAEGKSKGGIAGVLGTSDKDFTGRDRLGKGAYEDEQAHYQSNTSGPSGHSALTGREGDISNNPVAQAKGLDRDAHAAEEGQEKKSIVDKVKDVLK
ncbi:hypothetical protein BD324DRAFT_477498 [Kockovaella imperatae]|uniref:Uncharacterized protein n=1 Tax=Kockovaella imperatae TaxID=4999 RepID=A0A1Y1UHD8_9TREE|nr:hypothetical protein BD324DRAFT_477498 [Kockovaella imperatae]ORX36906.1 hypothetical protein BD324DRAFT_477498 [Kockovaella imperatae]